MVMADIHSVLTANLIASSILYTVHCPHNLGADVDPVNYSMNEE